MKDLLYEDLVKAMGMIDEDKTQYYAQQMIEEGRSPHEILEGLNEGLKQVEQQFEDGEYFIADLMFSGMLYRSVLDILVPPAKEGETLSKKARVLIGVVEEDIHEIGKNIVAGLLITDNFEVIDLGIDVKPQAFVDAIAQYHPQFVLLSGMMHFAQDSMKKTIEMITAAGLRDQVYILLGGGCVDHNILKNMDADASAYEPEDTLKYCNEHVNAGRIHEE